jgi:WD40 repeat protein
MNAVAFSPYGSLLASASRDQTVRLWNASKGQELQEFENIPDNGRTCYMLRVMAVVRAVARHQVPQPYFTLQFSAVRPMEKMPHRGGDTQVQPHTMERRAGSCFGRHPPSDFKLL